MQIWMPLSLSSWVNSTLVNWLPLPFEIPAVEVAIFWHEKKTNRRGE
jgi:hypothetical protein